MPGFPGSVADVVLGIAFHTSPSGDVIPPVALSRSRTLSAAPAAAERAWLLYLVLRCSWNPGLGSDHGGSRSLMAPP